MKKTNKYKTLARSNILSENYALFNNQHRVWILGKDSLQRTWVYCLKDKLFFCIEKKENKNLNFFTKHEEKTDYPNYYNKKYSQKIKVAVDNNKVITFLTPPLTEEEYLIFSYDLIASLRKIYQTATCLPKELVKPYKNQNFNKAETEANKKMKDNWLMLTNLTNVKKESKFKLYICKICSFLKKYKSPTLIPSENNRVK